MKKDLVATNLTKEQIDNIKNYDKKIKTLETFAESVRKNPGQYLSDIGNEGFMNCIREILQNATDEMERTISPCNKVWIEFYEGSYRTIVTDNGRGLPPEDIVRIYTSDHTSTNYDKKQGDGYTSGVHGSGSKAVNAVSSIYRVTTYRLGKGYTIEFSEGKPLKRYAIKQDKKISYYPKEIPNKQNLQGTIVDFEPDFKIMGQITITVEDVYNMIKDLLPLYNINDEIEFTGYKLDGTVIHDDMINKDGVLTFLIRNTTKPLIKPIMYRFDNGLMKLDAAITYTANINQGPLVETFANCTKVDTERSTPSKGFYKGLCDFFRNYMNKIFLANSRKNIEVTNSDCLTGLIAAIASAHIHPIFDSQAKNVCKNKDLYDFVKDLTTQALNNWSKENPDDLQRLCGFLKDVATARINADKEKIKIDKKYRTNTLTGTPKGFIKAENKNHLELFIVEGLSAASPCQTGRDTSFQAIFPIRGKMPNAFSKTKAEFLKNEEVQAIIGILGCGYGKNFDISKCKYDKIIILSDADFDGYHIRTLVLIFLLTYCRPLIEDGRVYAALSPLYHVDKGTKKWKYFIDKNDFIRYVRDEFCKNHNLKHIKTKKDFSKQEIQSLIINNDPYVDEMDKISSNFAINPILLEDILILRNSNYNKMKKELEAKYKYLKVGKDKRSGLVEIQGLAFDKAYRFLISPELLNPCYKLLPYIDNSEKRYLLDKVKVGLYEILKVYRNSEPKNIERAKGLGLLNDVEIGKSTLSPQNRMLLRYSAKDIEKEIQEMRAVNDDKYTLLKDVDVSNFEF